MKVRVFISGVLLIAKLFLILMHFKGRGIEFYHYNGIHYSEANFWVFTHLLYTACLYPIVLTIIRPDTSYFRINIIWIYLIYDLWNWLDYYFYYFQTPYREAMGAFLIIVTSLWVADKIFVNK